MTVDATTQLKFRWLLERHDLTRRMFETINADLADQGLFLKQGTVVDATLFAAAHSTNNKDKARDPRGRQFRQRIRLGSCP